MFKISTDCNDNGQWDDAETSDLGNGIWDPAEPFLNQGGDSDVEYDTGEPFLIETAMANGMTQKLH